MLFLLTHNLNVLRLIAKLYIGYLIVIFYQESFVGAFASANLGDVSPNTKGAKCIDTGRNLLLKIFCLI